MQLKITIRTSTLFFLLLFHIVILAPIRAHSNNPDDNKATISGYVKDAKNGEVLIGATIAIKGQMLPQ